jgi:DNA-binding MarR family transcriptional regulator
VEKKKIEELRKKLRILERETGGVFEDRGACCGVTSAQCHTILEIGHRRKISLVDLADALGLDPSTMSRTIQGLVVAGFVDRKANDEDRRYVKLSLTEEGRRIFVDIETRYNAFFREVAALLPEDRRDEVLSAVGEFADAVHRHRGSADRSRKGSRS